MEEGVDEIKVSWGVSHLDTVQLEVTPTFTQVHFDQHHVIDSAQTMPCAHVRLMAK